MYLNKFVFSSVLPAANAGIYHPLMHYADVNAGFSKRLQKVFSEKKRNKIFLVQKIIQFCQRNFKTMLRKQSHINSQKGFDARGYHMFCGVL